jgi:MinD-like ATPase involved in chromosome partitioning or flagellar assembly
MEMTNNDYKPAGRLVPVFAAHDGLSGTSLAFELSKAAAARGETVLMLDLVDGALMREAGIVYGKTLGDVLYRKADVKDAKYISQNEHFTAACAGDATLDALLGSLAALSLKYDWVFVGVEQGCTPAHVRLASAADTALLAYASETDRFMRAYWMLDAIRARSPKFDPLMIVEGEEAEAFETFDMLVSTVREFLGAPPALGGILETPNDTAMLAPTLLESLRQETAPSKRVAS